MSDEGMYQEEILRLRTLLTEERRAARTDVLTGLGNLRSFKEALVECYDSGQPFALLMFDAANLHAANLKLGHDGADALLKRIAERIRDDSDRAFRTGGDEFAVLLPGVSEQPIAETVRNRIEAAVGTFSLAPGVTMFLAGGAAVFDPRLSVPIALVLRTADQRCEENKLLIKRALGDCLTREEAKVACG